MNWSLPSLSRIVLGVQLLAAPWAAGKELPDLATAALSGDASAITGLRAAGASGLAALLKAAAPQVAALRQGTTRLDEPQAASLRSAVEQVARQRDAWAS